MVCTKLGSALLIADALPVEEAVCSACRMMSGKVKTPGALSMYALSLASQRPSALVDWNNNYGATDDKCVLFHCGNWAKSFLPDIKVLNAPILGSTLGVENTWGALDGRTPASPLTFGRITTADNEGAIRLYARVGMRVVERLP